MTARRVAGARLLRTLAPGAVVLLVAASCASLPSSSAPQVIDTFSPSAPQTAVPTPVPDQEPDLLVRDFLKAAALADQRHAAARQFLTDQAAQSWDDSPSTTIVLRADLSAAGGRSEDHATYTLRGEKVGSLDPGGIYREESGDLEVEIALARENGQWRIDRLPAGVVIERTEFFSTYAQRDLYFLSATGDALVPDPRWTAARRGDLGYALVNLLATGARSELAEGVRSQVPQSVSVRPSDRDPDQQPSGTTIDFQGLPVFGTQAATQFAAQVVWTLAQADVQGPYRLERDGSPIDERHADGWTVDDVASFAPTARSRPATLALTAADGLLRIDGAGARPAGGAWSQVRGGRSGAVSRDGGNLAVATGSEDGSATLYVGAVDGAPERVLESRSLSVPTFTPVGGAVWAVVDGNRLVSVVPGGGRSRVEELDPAPLRALGGPVSDLRIDPTGSRLAVVVQGRVYIGTIRVRDGRPLQGSFRQIGRGLGETAESVAWQDASTVVVGRRSTEAPVVTLSVDGALTEPLSARNITAPVSAVAAAGREVFAVDQRALLRLDTGAETGDRYWREVTGLAAIRAFPVVSG